MKILKLIGIVLLLIIIGLGVWGVGNWKHVNAFPSIISAWYSKLMCSCLFVEGRSEKECHNWAKQYIPIKICDIDTAQKKVTVVGLGRTNTASYRGERFGCTLE